MIKFFMVITGGGLGALCRYTVSLAAARYFGARFPVGTLMVNLVGCFLIGGAFALADRTDILTPSARLFFMTGFLGALTTFSTYALETVRAFQTGSYSVAVINFVINNLGGMAFVLAGVWSIQLVLRGS